jgi:hypothetical protein
VSTGDFVTGTAASFDVAMGDINGDGRTDVAVSNHDAANELYLGTATRVHINPVKNSGQNRPGVYGRKIEINSSWSGV